MSECKSKCVNCGNLPDEAFPSGPSSCHEKKHSHRRKRRRVSLPDQCGCGNYHPYSTQCGCSKCKLFGGASTVEIWKEAPCDLGAVDEFGVDSSANYTNVPKAPKKYNPFTKDAFALIEQPINFPEVGGATVAVISNVVLADGQMISHDSYGTLVVHPLISAENCYHVENRADLNNPSDSVGKPIRCQSKWWLGRLSCNCEETAEEFTCNRLVSEFTVPDVSDTVEVEVESLDGFAVGQIIVIRDSLNPTTTYRYTLSDTAGLNTLVLQNTGEGGTPGTVIWEAEEGGPFCVEPLTAQNACAQATEATCLKYILGCDGDGNIIKTGISDFDNEALLGDTECGGFTKKVVPEAVTCVQLDTCFQVSSVDDTCDVLAIEITTNDDQSLLDKAADVLLSDNAEPQITICGYPFTLNLQDSVVGAILVKPVFNPYETVHFDTNCPVCIPESCCVQCNPQVQYPDEDYFPPGLNDALTVAIPTNLLQAPSGEYKLSIAKSQDGSQNLLFYHDPSSNEVLFAYDGATGEEIALEDLPGDVNDYYYHKLTYCQQESACPVDGQFESDILVKFFSLPEKMRIMFNYHAQIDVYPCESVGAEGSQLTSTQFSLLASFLGPTVLSTIAFGTDPWGAPAPEPDGQKPWDGFSGYNKRTFALFYPTCVEVIIRPTIFIYVDPGWERMREEWHYDSASTVTVPSDATYRYGIDNRIKFLNDGVVKEYVITNVAADTLTLSGPAIVNSTISQIYLGDNRTIPPEDDFIYLNLETTDMFSTKKI